MSDTYDVIIGFLCSISLQQSLTAGNQKASKPYAANVRALGKVKSSPATAFFEGWGRGGSSVSCQLTFAR